jgi:hypothetical protein
MIQQYGNYTVKETSYGTYSVWRHDQPVDEFKNYNEARKKAKALSEAENPAQSKIDINNRLVELWRKAGMPVVDDYFMTLPVSSIRKEIARMEKALVREGKL